jgi:hypothetical protein
MSEIKVNKISPRSGTTLTLGDSGDDFIIPAGATLTNNGTASGFASIAWQSSIVTGSTLTAVSGNGYWIDTTSNACTVTLPASASVGDTIEFTDYARTWGTNAITINQNSLNFQGATSPNPVYNSNGQHVTIVYSGATQGWIPTVDDDVTWKTQQTYSVDFLVIAGGGGGGRPDSGSGTQGGGGGGAGGYRNSFGSEASGGGGSSETELTFTIGAVYTITVGAGGDGATTILANGSDGTDSSISGTGISTITSIAGGGGGGQDDDGNSGGSGGGASSGGSAVSGGAGTANQGYNGGTNTQTNYHAGGGGGAGAVGSNDTGNGNGGNGVASSITGSSVTRAGGGGGGPHSSNDVQGSGGSGGGGASGISGSAGTAGTDNTGGGGGGGTQGGQGANGGSGVVILRMPDENYSGTTTGSPTVNTNVGGTGETVLIFNASGSYTA